MSNAETLKKLRLATHRLQYFQDGGEVALAAIVDLLRATSSLLDDASCHTLGDNVSAALNAAEAACEAHADAIEESVAEAVREPAGDLGVPTEGPL